LPAGKAWTDFGFVMGGYGWKALYVTTDNKFYTAGADAQFNVKDGSVQPYHQGEDIDFTFACYQCHTTGPVDVSPPTYAEIGVACEACHGPASEHVAGAFQNPRVYPPYRDAAAIAPQCQACHQNNGGASISAANGFIVSSGQFDELSASKMGKIGMTCTDCHRGHVAVHYPDASAAEPFVKSCQSAGCHPTKENVKLDGLDKGLTCQTCHMSRASVNAMGMAAGNGWVGDVRTHIFQINSAAVTKDEMFTPDGSAVKVDGQGLAAVTLDFVCLQCHTDKTVEWASFEATTVHTTGLHRDHTATEQENALPSSYELLQNYPNPFNPSTTIRFDLPETANVLLQIYSVDGRLVDTMLDQRMPAGSHHVDINLSMLPSGNYLYRLTAGSYTASKTMTLLK